MGFALSTLQLTSPAFKAHGEIPKKHTGEDADVSPALAWSNVPEGTQSFALICHDPDAPLVRPGTYGFVHWVLYDIPGSVTELPEDVDAYTCGLNDMDHAHYNGPMPPPGHGVHHYYFWLLALDDKPKLGPRLTLWQLLEKIEPHVIGMNRLVGTYSRK